MEADPRFPTTRWHAVLRAGDSDDPSARSALDDLCRAYWFPIYAFIRRRGHDPDRAADLTQGFFARILERGTIASADPGRGRFRSFLLASCAHYLADEHVHRNAIKRGGGRAALSIDARDAEGRLDREPVDHLTPERLFDRDWALTLLRRVLDRLGDEYRSTGRGAAFEALKPALADGEATPSAELATRLGTSEGAAQVAAHRLRKRYRAVLLDEIGATVAAGEVDEELNDLFAALAT